MRAAGEGEKREAKQLGPAGEASQWAEFEKGRMKFVSIFQTIFPTQFECEFQIKLKFDFKSHHSKINMQQHECTHMIVNLYLILI